MRVSIRDIAVNVCKHDVGFVNAYDSVHSLGTSVRESKSSDLVSILSSNDFDLYVCVCACVCDNALVR